MSDEGQKEEINCSGDKMMSEAPLQPSIINTDFKKAILKTVLSCLTNTKRPWVPISFRTSLVGPNAKG